MSRFIDRLEGLEKSSAPSMGFHRAEADARPVCMLVAVELNGRPDDELREVATTAPPPAYSTPPD